MENIQEKKAAPEKETRAGKRCLLPSGNAVGRHSGLSDRELRKQIRQKQICLAGNLNVKIFGRLHCRSGKRMKKENRVFFRSWAEAIQRGFRPCGHCLASDYKKWKHGLIQ